MKLIEEYEDKNYRVRPIAITILCVLMLIGSVGGLVSLFAIPELSDSWAEKATWYITYLYILYPVNLACAIGLWRMDRWAFIGFGTVILLSQIVMISIERFTFRNVIFVLILSWILARYFPQTKKPNNSDRDRTAHR